MPKKRKVDILSPVMKEGIHPKVNKTCVVTCACGNSFTTISTLDSMSVEICSMCHPFYTGHQKFVDTEGRIDKFVKKQKVAQGKKQKADELKKVKAAKSKVKTDTTSQPTLKEMLEEARKQTS